MINHLQALANKTGGSLFEVDLQAQAGSMASLSITNTFSAVQSPTQSMVSELTNATLVPAARIIKNAPTVKVNEVSVQDSIEVDNRGGGNDNRSQGNQGDMEGESSVRSRSVNTGNAK